VSQDPYCYPGTETLKNLANIRDKAQLEQFETAAAMLATARQNALTGAFDLERLKATHKLLFGRVYEWAGKLRENTGTMSKDRPAGYTVTYGRDEYVPGQIAILFAALKKENYLKGLQPEQFAQRLAHYYGELDTVHAFREGNSRTLRLFTSQLAHEAGHKLDWTRTLNTDAERNKLFHARDLVVLRADSSELSSVVLSCLGHREQERNSPLETQETTMPELATPDSTKQTVNELLNDRTTTLSIHPDTATLLDHYAQGLVSKEDAMSLLSTLTPHELEEVLALSRDWQTRQAGSTNTAAEATQWAELAAGLQALQERDYKARRADFLASLTPEERATLAADGVIFLTPEERAALAAEVGNPSELTAGDVLDDADHSHSTTKKPNFISKEPIAVRLTEEQAKLLLSAEYPNDAIQQDQALADIQSGTRAIDVMNIRVGLDYSEELGTYFATLAVEEKPALDQKLTQLQAESLQARRQQNQTVPRSKDMELPQRQQQRGGMERD
jgi:fido (protein-threonine AMPylation protein)